MIWDNVERRISAAARILEHTEAPGISNIAKSSYYRSAIIILCTVVEGMVYELVKKHTTAPEHLVILKSKTYKFRHKIPNSVFGGVSNFAICEEVNEDISIDDTRLDFGKFNIYLKNKKHVTVSQFNILNSIRLERNKIHVQGLNSPDTGYTKLKIEKIGKALNFLESKIS